MEYQTINLTAETKNRLVKYKTEGGFDTMEELMVSMLDYMDKQYIAEAKKP